MKHSEKFLTLVADAKSRIQEIDPDTVYQKLQNKEAFHLIDVREESEWHRGHLPEAIHLGKGIIERDIEERISDLGAEIILYCGGGFRSALAADALQKMGYSNIYSMDGGFREWTNIGYPVEHRD